MSKEASPIELLAMPPDSMPTTLPMTSGILPKRPTSSSKGIYLEYNSSLQEDRPLKTNITPSPIWGNPFWVFTSPSRSMERSRSVPRPFRPSGERTTAVFPDFSYPNFRRFFPGKLSCFFERLRVSGSGPSPKIITYWRRLAV